LPKKGRRPFFGTRAGRGCPELLFGGLGQFFSMDWYFLSLNWQKLLAWLIMNLREAFEQFLQVPCLFQHFFA